jgi:hypothetical protein
MNIETGIKGEWQETDFMNATLQSMVYGKRGFAISIATYVVPEAFPINVRWDGVSNKDIETMLATVMRELLAPIEDEGAFSFEVQIGRDEQFDDDAYKGQHDEEDE